MESDLGQISVRDEEGDLGQISVRDEEESKTTPANPQLRFYFFILLSLVGLSAIILVAVKPMSEEDHPFKAHGGFYTIITITSLSVAVLTSGVLIFTSCYFPSCMMDDIHYNILKTISCSSATLAPVCLLALIYVPHNLSNWIASSVMSLLFTGFLVAYNFLWKAIPPTNKPLHPSALLLFLHPLSVASVAFISPDDPPIIKYSLICLCFTTLVAAGCYVVFHDLYLIGESKVCNLELHHVSQQDKTITHP